MPRRKKAKRQVTVLHKRIRELRTGMALTQEQLARSCGLTDKSSVAQWERGAASPRADVLPRLATALGVQVSDLFVAA